MPTNGTNSFILLWLGSPSKEGVTIERNGKLTNVCLQSVVLILPVLKQKKRLTVAVSHQSRQRSSKDFVIVVRKMNSEGIPEFPVVVETFLSSQHSGIRSLFCHRVRVMRRAAHPQPPTTGSPASARGAYRPYIPAKPSNQC